MKTFAMFGEIVWFMNGIKRSSSTSTNSSADTPVSDSSDRSLELEVEELASPALPQFFPHFGNWNINESQTPSRPTWPRPFPVVKGSLGPSLLSRIFLHRKSGIPISRLYLTPMYLFIFDILTYFREFFLLLCWHNARC